MKPNPHNLMVEIPDTVLKDLNVSNAEFLKRMYVSGTQVYLDRLQAIGFHGMDTVLDAGMGFGQWTIGLAQLNKFVHGVDIGEARVDTARAIMQHNNITNVDVKTGALEDVQYPAASFDGIFSYSVLYHTNESRSLENLASMLKPRGVMYLNFNGIGWYLHLLLVRGILKRDGESFRNACRALSATLLRKKQGAHALSTRAVAQKLRDLGFTINAIAGDGGIRLNPGSSTRSFYRPRYCGLEGVSEILATKNPA